MVPTEVSDALATMAVDAVAVAVGVLLAIVATRSVKFIRSGISGDSRYSSGDTGSEWVQRMNHGPAGSAGGQRWTMKYGAD